MNFEYFLEYFPVPVRFAPFFFGAIFICKGLNFFKIDYPDFFSFKENYQITFYYTVIKKMFGL